MNYRETPLLFSCEGELLLSVLAVPDRAADVGVLVVVGGPQYRVGSHRQFVHLARHLASHGFACMRFDVRGMGDSTGQIRNFENVGPDIAAAIDAFCTQLNLNRVVLWGLCDGATAASFYAAADHRVAGLVLLNPWVRTEEGEAKAYLHHYYIRRLFDKTFWNKIVSGKVHAVKSLRSFVRAAAVAWRIRQNGIGSKQQMLAAGDRPLPVRMAEGLDRFRGPVLFILSGNDRTAAEFDDVVTTLMPWRSIMSRETMSTERLAHADHTFARKEWTEHVGCSTVEWIATKVAKQHGPDKDRG